MLHVSTPAFELLSTIAESDYCIMRRISWRCVLHFCTFLSPTLCDRRYSWALLYLRSRTITFSVGKNMNIYTYTLACYGLTAVISLFVIAVILGVDKLMKDSETSNDD